MPSKGNAGQNKTYTIKGNITKDSSNNTDFKTSGITASHVALSHELVSVSSQHGRLRVARPLRCLLTQDMEAILSRMALPPKAQRPLLPHSVGYHQVAGLPRFKGTGIRYPFLIGDYQGSQKRCGKEDIVVDIFKQCNLHCRSELTSIIISLQLEKLSITCVEYRPQVTNSLNFYLFENIFTYLYFQRIFFKRHRALGLKGFLFFSTSKMFHCLLLVTIS